MAAELEIPEAAYAAMLNEQDDWESDDHLATAIRDVAAPVVAAELRRIADEIYEDTGGWAIAMLRARADELDGGA